MKMIVAVTLALVAVVSAAPVDEKPIETLRSSFDQNADGSYISNFETSNGIVWNSIGEPKEVLNEDNKPVVVVIQRGSYQYPGVDGKPVIVQYIADEQGYRAEGDSIPKPTSRR